MAKKTALVTWGSKLRKHKVYPSDQPGVSGVVKSWGVHVLLLDTGKDQDGCPWYKHSGWNAAPAKPSIGVEVQCYLFSLFLGAIMAMSTAGIVFGPFHIVERDGHWKLESK